MITVQYLEPGPHLTGISPKLVRSKLIACFEILPVDCVLLGWNIPPSLEDICRKVTMDHDAKLYRWHPVLTGDGIIHPKKRWRTQNIDKLLLSGFRDLPEFTFICPNNLEARYRILDHVDGLAKSGKYQGFFLDRMRFPSPTDDPVNALSCFCEFCAVAAGKLDLDLEEVRQSILNMDKMDMLRGLFGQQIQPLSSFLEFRKRTISEFIEEIVQKIRVAELEIGLDTFSPSLTNMVGQDLRRLAPLADWTKVMIYMHAFGPATIPYELSSLENWMRDIPGTDLMRNFTEITGFIHSNSKEYLGSTSLILTNEYNKGRFLARKNNLLAGIELVEIQGISELKKNQIESDIQAIKATGAYGLSLSWDLWWIPIEHLDLARSVWFS